jgi:hypothetical protein
MMPFAVGGGLALAVGLFATLSGFDRDKAFYPTVTIVVASLYALFAAMAADTRALALESAVGLVFVGAALLGFKRSLWIAAVALSGHGVLDFFHARLIANPGVPQWWPAFCGTYDVVAGAYLALLLRSRRGLPRAAERR